MKSLYLLALLLTAEQHAAERCFASSLGDCIYLTSTLNEWTDSWTRRVVLQNAIRMLGPATNNNEEIPSSHRSSALRELNPALHAVLQLKTFERFVFVMSLLEGYSDSDCSRLLKCSKRDVVAARAQASVHLVGTFREGSVQALGRGMALNRERRRQDGLTPGHSSASDGINLRHE